MNKKLLAAVTAISLLYAPDVVLAQVQCTMADLGQRVACLEAVIKTDAAARRHELAPYVTETELSNRAYITDSTLTKKGFVPSTELDKKTYITKAELANEK